MASIVTAGIVGQKSDNGWPQDRSGGILRTHGTDVSEKVPSEVELPTRTGGLQKNQFKLGPLAPRKTLAAIATTPTVMTKGNTGA